MVDIEKLVSEARARLERTKDNKAWCRTSDIRALLEAEATLRGINQEQAGGNYLHEVSYKGIIFVNITNAPVQALERYSEKK